MTSFKFRNRLTLNIEGHDYDIDTSMVDVSKAIADMVNDCAKIQKMDVSKQSDALNHTCIQFCTTVLGEQAVKRIVGKRVLDRMDWIDLSNFINQQIIEFKRNKLETFMGDHVQSDSGLLS